MTDRTVNVRLQATVDQYHRAMGTAVEDTRRLDRQVEATQKSTASNYSRMGRSASVLHLATRAATAGVGLGLGAIVVQSVKTAASFETTMRQIAVATGLPTTAIKGLSDLALKYGQDTVFSAQEAGDAMLELAKGGLTAAQIKSGALGSTLTLASAGGLSLGDAAGYIVQGLTTFNLSADKSASVAAALAGGANASTASVQDMGLALSQVGPGASLAGLSLQQTVGVLAAFAQNGIKGSDAGTSLKTMLARLVPQTASQKKAMHELGLQFTDAHGAFLSVDAIAQQLHDHLGGLSAAQRTTALNTIFGTDASRAAAVLMKEGAKGVRDYTKAASDQTQANKLAAAATSGTAGALSQLSGSVDTAKLQLGQALAPIIVDLADHLTTWTNQLTTDGIPKLQAFIKGMEDGTGPGGKFRDILGEIGSTAESAWKTAQPLFGFIGAHPDLFKAVAGDAVILAGAMKVMGTVKKFQGLPGLGGGGGMGKASSPIPVYVTNAGFGGVGAGGGPLGNRGPSTFQAIGPTTMYAAAVTNVPFDKTKLDKLAVDPKIRAALGLDPYVSPEDKKKHAQTRQQDILEDPKRAAAALQAQHDAIVKSQQAAALLQRTLGTAAGAAKTVQNSTDLITGSLITANQAAVILGQTLYGLGVGRATRTDSAGTYVQGTGGKLGLDTATPALRTSTTTIGKQGGLHIDHMTVTPLPGQSTGGAIVRDLEHAAFLASAG